MISAALLCSGPALSAADEFTTLAGSGAPGVADGSAREASFLMPYGVAVARDGTVYVSDYLGQRIRAIDSAGNVRTIAGGGQVASNGLEVRGGYADGPGVLARFNGPKGIALDESGRLYVADSKNQCIRVIDAGNVTTYAGAPGRGGNDGKLETAGFHEPRALAFDQLGTLWVADGINGLRKITRPGTVSTVRLPATAMEPGLPFASHITSIVADGSFLDLADGFSILRFNTEQPAAYAYTQPALIGDPIADRVVTSAGAAPAGYPFALAIVAGVLVYTDPVMHAIRAAMQYVNTPLSAAPLENADFIAGGFGDGSRGVVDAPLGISPIDGDAVVFADAGNRRIRTIRNIETRQIGDADIPANAFGMFHDAHKYYRILCAGTSDTEYDVPFTVTAAGRLESLFEGHRADLGLVREPKLAIVRSTTIPSMLAYLKTVASNGTADAIIWDLSDAAGVNDAFGTRQPQNVTAPSSLGVSFDQLEQIQGLLRDSKVKLYVVVHPQVRDLSPLEEASSQATYGDGEPTLNSDLRRACSRLFGKSGCIDLWPEFLAAEEQRDRRPLYSSRGERLTPYAQELIAKAVYERLTSDRPWSQTP